MSGGSYDYFCFKVENIAEQIGGTPQRDAFAAHLKKVAKALHDIEWVDSCDYGKGDENAAILDVIGPGAVIDAAVSRAEAARDALADLIVKAKVSR